MTLTALAALQLELLGQSRWWAAVTAAAGIMLLIYAQLLRKDPEPLMLRRWRIGRIAVLLAIISFLLTPLLLFFDAPTLALAWTLLLLLAAVFLFYQRAYSALSRTRLAILFSLRSLGVLALTFLLFEPVLGFVRNPTTRPRLAIIVDASGSMGYSDAANEPNRYRQSAIAVQDILAPRLSPLFDIQCFAYDGKHTAPLPSPAELDQIPPTGEVTDLGAAIGLGASAGASQLILLSDGIHNGASTLTAELDQSNPHIPVHTIRVGSSDLEPSNIPDISVVSVEGPQTITVNNQATFTASIKSTAMSDRTIRVLLKTVDEKGASETPLDEQRLVLASGTTPQTVQLKFTPTKTERMTLRVQVPVDPSERSETNNIQDVGILVTDPKLAVLYVEGRVRPEVGPLRRMLEQDPNIAAISMVQTQAGRFELSGIKPGDDLHGLPTTAAQWKHFKAVILGDLDASYLSADQQKGLEEAVRDGTGLLMIGGQNSFAPGGWDKTVLATLLPVSLDPITPAQINARFVPELTAAGEQHPIFRNITGYFLGPGNKPAAQQQMPDLSGCVALASAKPGAEILAIHPTATIAGQPAIVLAVQQYAKGRTAAFAADTTWHWNLFLRGLGKDSPYNRFWGQLVRWLASEDDLQKKSGPSVTALLAKEHYDAGEPVTLRAAVTDAQGQSTNYAQVSADITSPDGKKTRIPLAAQTDQGSIGTYEAPYQPALAGNYKVTFTAAKEGKDLGADSAPFTVLAAASEKDVLAARPDLLQQIARATGGNYVELSGAAALADRLAAELPTSAASIKTTLPLYHNRGFFLLFIAAFATEWLLRRKWQLQ